MRDKLILSMILIIGITLVVANYTYGAGGLLTEVSNNTLFLEDNMVVKGYLSLLNNEDHENIKSELTIGDLAANTINFSKSDYWSSRLAHWSFDDYDGFNNSSTDIATGHTAFLQVEPANTAPADLKNDGYAISNNAVYFNGQEGDLLNIDRISVNSDDFNIKRNLTISLWFKVKTNISGDRFLIHKGLKSFESRAYAVNIRQSDGILQFFTRNTNDQLKNYIIYDDDIKNGKWVHFLGILNRDRGEIKVYINGKYIEPENSSLTIDKNEDNLDTFGHKLLIGASSEENANNQLIYKPFHGIIDEVIIWNEAINPEKIMLCQDIYNCENTKIVSLGNEGLNIFTDQFYSDQAPDKEEYLRFLFTGTHDSGFPTLEFKGKDNGTDIGIKTHLIKVEGEHGKKQKVILNGSFSTSEISQSDTIFNGLLLTNDLYIKDIRRLGTQENTITINKGKNSGAPLKVKGNIKIKASAVCITESEAKERADMSLDLWLEEHQFVDGIGTSLIDDETDKAIGKIFCKIIKTNQEIQ